MSRPDRRTAARNYLPESKLEESKLEDLAVRLRRLANHQGLVRSEIASPMLLRLLPAPRRGEPRVYENALRQRLVEADLDSDRVSYLMAHAEQEIDIAHARLAG